MAVLLVVGLVRATYLAVTGVGDDTPAEDLTFTVVTDPATGDVVRGAAYRDEVAAAPMLTVNDQAMFPAQVAREEPAGFEIPIGEAPGPAQIQSGFPHTPEGAVGQLAQIDLAVLQAMSLPTAHEVYQSWALPGGIGADRWWITQSVAAFLSSTSMGEVMDAGTWVEAEPAAALIKGVDGPDWVVACVLFKVTATYRQEAQIAFGHCERMQWVGGRWMIAPGLPPAPAPSTWPGTDLANQAGWRPWISTHPAKSGTGR
ncbi:hypothetical protein [Brevibacterium sp. Mu109]|uniref:hypothetical protein n=1 Tax=Brevibacterium sp. Mu109 TaxID=1255669 RepID=UPI000C790571|nr:hypothetical protein [Brevibacterium sp. Mu109]